MNLAQKTSQAKTWGDSMRWQRRIKNTLSFLYSILLSFQKKELVLSKGARVGIGSKITLESGGKLEIGANTHCAANVTVLVGAKICIGTNTWINKGVTLGCAESICIGTGVMVAHGVTIYDNNNHPIELNARIEIANSGYTSELLSWRHAAKSPVEIGDYVWIGMHSIILKGVRIGRGAIVAAGSVVVHDVPDMCIVAGNPARPVKYLDS